MSMYHVERTPIALRTVVSMHG